MPIGEYYKRQRSTSRTWVVGDVKYPVTPSQFDALTGLAAVFKRIRGFYASQMTNGTMIVGCYPDQTDAGISVDVDRRGRVMPNKSTR